MTFLKSWLIFCFSSLMSFRFWLVLCLIVSAGITIRLVTRPNPIHQTINQLVDAIRDNDIERSLSFFDTSAKKSLEDCRHYMGLAHVQRVRISQFHIVSTNKYSSPPSAIAAFNAGATVRENRFGGIYSFIVVFDQVELIQTGEKTWKITDRFEYHLPQH